ncbi:unnamed protein product [Caenorhabditis angaria]|uniref:Nascent polypeptide-associated complex subunit alpha-like UBA domain-containing protein n=1 Tax=Caenorhabditis angaria TaxID=860376 RepID=A0A9P1I4A9_9PELO|nr:unnamed protein product [Caenorhabditis angaria]
MTTSEEEKQVDKHNWGSDELSKVSDTQEEREDTKMSAAALDKMISSAVPTRPKINIKREDLLMIMNELELPEATVRSKLIETNGDARAALRSLIGF